MSLFSFLLLGLATFRLTRLLVYDQITEFLRAPFHDVVEEVQEDGTVEEVIHIKGEGIRKFFGELLSCHWCTGVWCSILLYIGYVLIPYWITPIIMVLSVAAVASIIQVFVDYFMV